MLPFIEELLNVVQRIDIDEYGLIPFMPDSDSEEEEEEYAMYNDDLHEDCYCSECERKIDIYEPPFTRLQKRNQETLINRNNKIIECAQEEINCWFEYMEEQKHYTKEELEQKLKECFPLYVYDFWNSIDYVTEQKYRDSCETINIIFKSHTSLLKDVKKTSFIQLLMQENDIKRYIDICKESHMNSMKSINHLRKITLMIQK
tara:strand:+ start:666 stop:1274 length:609 start_codon:yes stop_codon:yes gene_type:complete